MAVGGDYSTPVYVNGYACWNCAAVAEAKKDINPADPQAGPGGAKATTATTSTQSPAVILGGVLATGGAANATGAASPASQPSSPSATAQASPAVIFGGVLANSTAAGGGSQGAQTSPAWRQTSPALSSYAASGLGAQLDITV